MTVRRSKSWARTNGPGRLRSARGQSSHGDHDAPAKNAFFLFLVLIVFTLLSVPTRVPVLGYLRPTVLLVAVIAVLIMVASNASRRPETPDTMRKLNVLFLYMLLTVPFVQWPGSVIRFGLEGFVKAAVFFYFTVYLVTTHKRLIQFIATIVTCQVIRVLEPLYLHITTGYWGGAAHMGGGEFMDRLSGAPSDIINPNGLAFVVLTTIPFLHYLLGGSPKAILKTVYVLLLPALLYALVLTGSRSGMIGLVVVFGFICYRSRHRTILIALGGIAVVGMLAVMTPDMRDRYLSIVDRTSTRHAATSEGRVEGVMQDFAVIKQRPLFGYGVGTSREALANVSGRDQISHNLYTEVLIELGVLGFLLYIRVLVSIGANVASVGKMKLPSSLRGEPNGRSQDSGVVAYYLRVREAAMAWFVMCLAFSLASYGLSEFYWYMVAGLSVALVNLFRVETERGVLEPNRVLPTATVHTESQA